MSNISDFNIAANAQTDREHQVQLSMLRALCQAVREQKDATSIAQRLDQLTAYCEAHFVSEELLMRQKSYDDYEDHVDDHNHMLDVLRDIGTDHAAGNSSVLVSKAEDALAFIGNHITTRDKRFADFMRSGQ
jgi:hemerythrin-like metal-binding protein